MKVMTILGTRPEIIRLSCVIEKLDRYCDHVLVHTGQNYDYNLNELFFKELNVRKPDYFLGVQSASLGEQLGKILIESEKVIVKEKPDRLLILGDTNSSLSAIIAKRMGVPVYHMEAGNRCFDDRVPEEVNRRIIDHCSEILLPYTERSRMNLLREGIDSDRIYVTGNPIYEVIQRHQDRISKSDILEKMDLKKGQFFLVTVHRAENVDVLDRITSIIQGLEDLYKKYQLPVIISLHPHTKDRLSKSDIPWECEGLHYHTPFGLFDFIALEQNAKCVISDSGTVQEECCIFRTPNVTIRDVTERPETLECGSNILSGSDSTMILECVERVLGMENSWESPPEYLMKNVSGTVAKIVLGYHHTCSG